MYLIEWGFWKLSTQENANTKPADKPTTVDLYESELNEDIHFNSVSSTPRTRGPIFTFNDTYMEMRCGGSEEKRGIITLMTLGGLGPMTYAWLYITLGSIYSTITQPEFISPTSILFSIYMLSIGGMTYYLYARRPRKLSATPDLSGTVLPLCPIPNSALKNAPPFKSAVPKGSAYARLLA